MTGYTGNCLDTCRVHIDYEKNHVDFGYIQKPNKIYDYIQLTSFLVLLWLLPGILLAIKLTPHIGESLSLTVVPLPPIILGGLLLKYRTRWIGKHYPQIMYTIRKKLIGYYTYETDNLDNNTFEIPMFQNVGLDYRLTGDFATYIQKIDVTEHPFKYTLAGETRPQARLWKATFTFTQTPKQGHMKLEFA